MEGNAGIARIKNRKVSVLKFSIITPCYNSEKTIARTLERICNQTYTDFEYIVIDGASKDRTVDIVESYRARLGDKLAVVSEPDKGIYDAMNKGIALAKGELVGIVNSDDFYELDCLQTVAEHYDPQNGPYQILYGAMRHLSETGAMRAETFFHHVFLREQMINHPASFVTKALYDHFGVYDSQYRSAADLDFFLKMQQEPEVKFIPIVKVLTNFSSGGMSSTCTGVKETLQIQYKHGIIGRKSYLANRVKIWVKKKLGV